MNIIHITSVRQQLANVLHELAIGKELTQLCSQNGGYYLQMGESSKFPKSWTFETPILNLAVCPLNIHNFKFKWSIVFRQTVYKQENLL